MVALTGKINITSRSRSGTFSVGANKQKHIQRAESRSGGNGLQLTCQCCLQDGRVYLMCGCLHMFISEAGDLSQAVCVASAAFINI